MGALRVFACPKCGAPRRTKAQGRQTISCAACGAKFLPRDATDWVAPEAEAGPDAGTLTPEPEPPAAEAPPPPVAPPAGAAKPEAKTVGGVEVLPPASIKVSAVAAKAPAPKPDAPAPAPKPAPVTPPAKRPGPGYYGRILGRG